MMISYSQGVVQTSLRSEATYPKRCSNHGTHRQPVLAANPALINYAARACKRRPSARITFQMVANPDKQNFKHGGAKYTGEGGQLFGHPLRPVGRSRRCFFIPV